MTDYLSLEEVLAIHDSFTGAAPGVRDAGLIASAVARPQATAFGEDAYSGTWEKAAALLQSLACNHGFVDGNECTAWLAARVFLVLNGHVPDPATNADEAVEFVVSVAERRLDNVPAIASELAKFFTPRSPWRSSQPPR